MYTYRAQVVRVVDGDTMAFSVDLGLDVRINLTVRIYGIDTPEMGTVEGREAKAEAQRLMPVGSEVVLTTVKDRREKYGRYLGLITLPGGADYQKMMVSGGFARAVEWH